MSEVDEARARIAALERDPSHRRNPHAEQVLKELRLDDPAKNDPHGQVDPKWKQIGPDMWSDE